MNDLINAVVSEKSLIRSLGVSGIHFVVEVHLTEHNIEHLKNNTAYLDISRHDKNDITFMGCPVIKDTRDFVCTIHKINLVDKERLLYQEG